MGKRFFTGKRVRGVMLASAIAVAGPIAGNLSPNEACAASAAPVVPLASSACHGNIGNSPTDPNDLPTALFNEQFAFESSIQPAGVSKNITGLVSPLKKGGGNIGGFFVLTIDGACSNTAHPPCLQDGAFTGAIDKNGVMTLAFADIPGGKIGSDPLDGCQVTFQSYPIAGNTAAYSVATTDLIQTPTVAKQPAPPTCKAVGTRMVMGCTTNAE